MASPQPQPPSNPFDGFDVYSNVAAPPPQYTNQPVPPNQPQPQMMTSAPQPAMQPHQQQFMQQPEQPMQPVQSPQMMSMNQQPPMMAPQQPQPRQQQQQPPQNPMQTSQMGGALVPSTAPSNSYTLDPFAVPAASCPAPVAQNPFQAQAAPPPFQQQQQQQQQQLVVAPQSNNAASSPWALGPPAAAPIVQFPPAPSTASLQQQSQNVASTQLVPSAAPSDDPFGIFGGQQAAVQTQIQSQNQNQNQQMQNLHGQMQTLNLNNSNSNFANSQQINSNAAPAFDFLEQDTRDTSVLPDATEEEGLALVDVELDEDDEEEAEEGEFIGSKSTNNNNHQSKSSNNNNSNNSASTTPTRSKKSKSKKHDPLANIAPPPPPTPGRPYSEYLSKNSAPPSSSPLPQPHLVLHSGYVLSRISFRTILMRKWKQTFWIQYGPTQLLFFRTFSDYEDWLNNPYHSQEAREFLVKLRVDFVSDLKKTSVMGYQVTQIRRKPYGKNVMLHFKLERWMDYGPTIAAAFAARQEEMNLNQENNSRGTNDNTTNDVASLRKIILGCMRNARDAALVAQRYDLTSAGVGAAGNSGNATGGGGGNGVSDQQQYRGRYSGEEDNYGGGGGGAASPARTNHASYPGGAESSVRRRTANPSDMDGSSRHNDTEDENDEDSNGINMAAAPAPLAQPIDLLG